MYVGLKSVFKGREKGDKKNKSHFLKIIFNDYSISVVYTCQNKRHSTWDPNRVGYWGSRYFSKPRKNEKIKSLIHSLWGHLLTKSCAEGSEHCGGFPSLRKKYQECPAAEQSGIRTEQSPCWAVLPEHGSGSRRLQQHFHPNTLLATSLSFWPASCP